MVAAERLAIFGASNDESSNEASTSGERERKLTLMENPSADDVCPICFGNFVVTCRARCGHRYCGSCILQYWNFSAALRPCKCLMCLQRITKLIPEASLYHRRQAEISKVLQNVGDYNRLFVGGISGFMLSEEERLRDQREREELERHIRECDAAGTRKLSKKEEEEAIRRYDALENDGIKTLRKVSRREYLKKREQKKLEELSRW